MTTLYEITTDILQRINEVLELDGLDNETLDTLIPSLKMEAIDKQRNVAVYILNLNSDIAQMKEYKELMESKIKKAQERQDKLKNFLLWSMRSLDQKSIKTPEFSVTRRNNQPSLDVVDEKLVPEIYRKTEIVTTLNNKQIKDDLIKEIDVPGCQLVSRESLLIK